MPNTQGTIDRIEEDQAVLIMENGKQLLLPQDKFDFPLVAGQKVNISVTETADPKLEGEAKNIINRLLNT